MAAAFGGHVATVDALIALKADVNAAESSGRTALMATALGGNAAIAERLVGAGADVNAEDQGGLTALAYAAANGHLPLVQVLQKAGLKKGIETAVAFAIRGCYTDIVRALAAQGAPVDVTLQGSPAVVLAAGGNCTATLEFLLERGADVNARADDGTTPLIAAAQRGLVGVGEMLLARGADMELRNKAEQNAWLLAAMNSHLDFVELLRKRREQK
jgi:serine/threonine-protein phosphatase 6 regulatory ankyrin repeat subunit B